MRQNNERPPLIVIAGPNGSGKTSIAKQILAHDWSLGCQYVNPDEIARDTFGDWNSKDASLSAARLAEKLRMEAIENRRGLIFETVFSARDKVDYVRAAMDAGFFVRLFFICTETPTINASRIARRVMEGGHEVQISKIISRYPKSIANGLEASAFVDRAYIYDNSPEFSYPKLLLRTNNGRIAKRYEDAPKWAERFFDLPEADVLENHRKEKP